MHYKCYSKPRLDITDWFCLLLMSVTEIVYYNLLNIQILAKILTQNRFSWRFRNLYRYLLTYNDNSHLETDQVKRLHEKNTTLRIRDVYPGSWIRFFSIPDPEFFPSRIRNKESKYFNPKKWFLSSRKHDPGCSSRIPDPDPDFLTHPGSRRHRIPDPQHLKNILWNSKLIILPKLSPSDRHCWLADWQLPAVAVEAVAAAAAAVAVAAVGVSWATDKFGASWPGWWWQNCWLPHPPLLQTSVEFPPYLLANNSQSRNLKSRKESIPGTESATE